MSVAAVSSFLLIFFLIAVWLLTVHQSHQGGDIFLDDIRSINEVSTGREVFGHDRRNVAAAATAVGSGNVRAMMMRGRKMAAAGKRNRFAASERSAMITSTKEKKYYSRNWRTAEEKIKGDMKRDRLGRRSLLRGGGDHQETSLGFVAFNADYRGPRHHPPKNN